MKDEQGRRLPLLGSQTNGDDRELNFMDFSNHRGEAGEMSRWVKCLLGKHEDVNWDPQPQCENHAQRTLCNPSSEQCGWRHTDSRSSLAQQSSQVVSSRFGAKTPSQRNQVSNRQGHPGLTSRLHTCTPSHTHTTHTIYMKSHIQNSDTCTDIHRHTNKCTHTCTNTHHT